jgi:hypothetical protein
MNTTENSEHDWKLYNAAVCRIDTLNKRQAEEDDKKDRWSMSLASGSFGLSFAFINQIVPINSAGHVHFLIISWSCFLLVLILGLIGFAVSSFCHTLLAEEEAKNLSLKYKGIETEYKDRSVFFSANAVLGYASTLGFICGSIFLILFIAKNLLF